MPPQEPQYERFADIYAIWTSSAAATAANQPFYVERYLAASGPVVELGVGDGRIAVEAARQGCAVTGVDLSPAMLALCRRRAADAGVLDRLTLVEADFRDFRIEKPAELIALPYHSLGHLTTLADKRHAVRHVFDQLQPGGRFVFDDFLMTPRLRDHMRAVQLRAVYHSPTGRERLLWVTSLLDDPTQAITVVTWEDEVDDAGVLVKRTYRRLNLSWIEPAQARGLLTDAGFEVEACFGDFRGRPLTDASASEQVWIARKPDASHGGHAT